MAFALPLVAGIGGLLAGKAMGKSAAATPTPAPGPAVMPQADDMAVAAAKRRSLTQQQQRGGRQSTILSDTSEKLGG